MKIKDPLDNKPYRSGIKTKQYKTWRKPQKLLEMLKTQRFVNGEYFIDYNMIEICIYEDLYYAYKNAAPNGAARGI